MAILTKNKNILAARQTALPISYGNVVVDTQGRLNVAQLDKGIVEGYAIIWGDRSLTGYKFLKGCCARSIKEHGPNTNAHYQIKLLNQHNPDDPLALLDVLEEDELGLHFVSKPLDLFDVPGSSAHRLIVQLKSKTVNNFSHGFDWVWDKTEWDDTDNSLVGAEIQLFEISPVSIPAGLKTRQQNIQTLEQLGDVNDEISEFIKTLPSKYRMDARQLFALQGSLINLDAFKQTVQAKKDEPKIKKIDYAGLRRVLNQSKGK